MRALQAPDHCEAGRVDGAICAEFRGLQYCQWYGNWYCPRHHDALQKRRPSTVTSLEHGRMCGTPEQRRSK